MLITSIKQIVLIKNFNFDEKSLICFKKLNGNDRKSIFSQIRIKLHQFSQIMTKLRLQKMDDQFDIFE